MARKPVNQSDAEDTVFGNLGMENEDLGLESQGSGNDDELAEGSGQDDQGDDLEPDEPVQRTRQQEPDDQDDEDDQSDNLTEAVLDDLSNTESVTHTRPFPKAAPVKPDKKGNLVDAKTGKVVAKAGVEARLYTSAHKARERANAAETRSRDLETKLGRAVQIGQEINRELEALKAQNAESDKLGLNAKERLEALQLAVEAKTTPIVFIKKILTRAAANGINLSELGIQPGGVDPAAFMQMIKDTLGQHMKPLDDFQARQTQEQKTAEQERQEKDRATAEVQRFFTENREAQPFIPVFQRVLSDPRFSKMTLSEVWLRIQNNQLRMQLSGKSNGRGRNQRRQPSLPNGRGGPQGMDRQLEMADPNESYDTILRDVLDRAGA